MLSAGAALYEFWEVDHSFTPDFVQLVNKLIAWNAPIDQQDKESWVEKFMETTEAVHE